MTSRVLFLSILGTFILSGCENTRMAQYNPFGQNAADAQSVENVQMRLDTGEMTPLPSTPQTPALRQAGQRLEPMMQTGSVAISDPMFDTRFDTGLNPAFVPPPIAYDTPSLPNYGQGVLAADTSITIFPIDGPAPMMVGNSGTVSGYVEPAVTQNYAPDNNRSGQIFFEHGSSRLGSGDRNQLSNIAGQAKFAPVNRITVAGHSSTPTQAGSHSVEGHILNLKESMNRSFAVSKELMKNGVPAEKIKTVSWGATKPTGDNNQDRRVDVIMGEQ